MSLNIILNIIYGVGIAFGRLSGLICPLKTFGVRNYLSRSFHTGRLQSKFSRFGEHALLSKDIFIAGRGSVAIGKNSSIQSHGVLETCSPSSEIEIGDFVSLGEYCHITSQCGVKIGDGTLTGRFVLISDNSHGHTDGSDLATPPLQREVFSKGGINIGKNVWIGDKVSILQGVTIGKGAIIAANSVVTKSVPDFALVAGNPARIIRIMSL